ncbi:MAG: hypothetical protein HFG27_00840 [Provencibacterium sp.]|nr:hypothetical protein [Provencibacterium sp.]
MEKPAKEACRCRRLRKADIESVMAMNRDYREGFICREQALAFLGDEGCWLFAAMLEQTVIGFAYGYALREACREEGFCRFFLTAYRNNEGANALYRKLGGQVSGESRGGDIVYHFPVDAAF